MNNKTLKVTLILASVIASNAQAKALSFFDFKTQDYFVGFGVSKNILANEINTSENNGYRSSKKPKNKISGNIFVGTKMAKNIDAMLSLEHGRMSYKNGPVAAATFLNQIGGIGPVTEVQSPATSNLKFKYYNLSADFRYLFENNSSLSPFIGAGVGVAMIKTNDYRVVSSVQPESQYIRPGKTKKNLSYNLNVGVNYKICEKHSLQLFYKYQHLGNMENANKRINLLEQGNTLTNISASKIKSKVNLQTIGATYTINL